MKTTLTIAGYKAAEVKESRKSESVTILTGYIQKQRGAKSYHVTVQLFSNGTTKVFTVESLKNVEHKEFSLN